MFIAFEGVDGSGKTTQAQLLRDNILASDLGLDVVMVREPGGTPVGEAIRALLLGDYELSARAELMLFEAARAQLVYDVIMPALANDKVVITDRFTDSTIAYQSVRNISFDDITKVNDVATNRLYPYATVYLDLEPEEGLKRCAAHGKLDAIEKRDLSYHQQVYRAYKYAARHPAGKQHQWFSIDARRDIETISTEIFKSLDPLLRIFKLRHHL